MDQLDTGYPAETASSDNDILKRKYSTENVDDDETPNNIVVGGQSSTSSVLILKDHDDLLRHLELMHDRCITRNLQAAGLGGLDAQQEKLIYGNLDPNARMINGESVLIAVITNIKDVEAQVRYISILLNEGADPNTVDEDGKTALSHSCLMGNEKTTKALLHHPTTDITKKDIYGNTGLMYAAIGGKEKIVKMYIKAFRKLEKRLQRKNTKPFSEADENCNNFEHLFNDDALDDKNNSGMTAYDLASQNDHYECVQILDQEKSRRVKSLQKKLMSLSHQSRRSSNNTVQTAKQSLKRYQRGFGSFDAIFDKMDDKSDEELVEERSTNFSSKSNVISSRSNPNLFNAQFLQSNQNEQKYAQTPTTAAAAAAVAAATPKGDQNYNGPVLEKLSFWEEFFPKSSRTNARTASSTDEIKPNIGPKQPMKKSYTESSLSRHMDTAGPSSSGVVYSLPKKTIAQRLVSMLKRRGGKPNHNQYHQQIQADETVSSSNSPAELKLRKGHSQPELLRKISKDSTNSVPFQQRLVRAVQRHRQSVDLSVGKKQPNYQSYVNLSTDGTNQNNGGSLPFYNQKAHSQSSDVAQKYSEVAQSELIDNQSADNSNHHSPLKSRSSLPAISAIRKKSLPVKHFNESNILDRDVFSFSSQRKESFN